MGGTFKAIVSRTQMTVPGMAKPSMVPNSTGCVPRKFWRDRGQAVSRPMAAVSGADKVAICSVVQKLFQAEPCQCRPNSPNAIEKAPM